MRPFAENLKRLRQHKGWSQEKASRIIGIARASLGSYEEDRCHPSLENFARICYAYDIKDPVLLINEKYMPAGKTTRQKLSRLEAAFQKLDAKTKKAVTILLGLD